MRSQINAGRERREKMSTASSINNATIKALEAKAEAANKLLTEPEKALVLAFAAGVAAGANSAAHIKQ